MASTLTTMSHAASEELAVAEMVQQLESRSGGGTVRGAIFYCTVHHDTTRLQAALKAKLPGIPFIGTTSYQGVGASPAEFATGRSLVGFWLLGDGFRFGVAAADKGTRDPTAIGKDLASQALASGGFSASDARFAVIHPTPGDEEALLSGVYQTLNKQTPIIGGSAADDDLSGRWSSFTHDQVTRNGVVLALCNWPWRLAINYQAGYLAEGKRGRVTRAKGRVLYTIDGRPAADVYNEWTGGKISAFLEKGGNVLAQTTMNPFGVPHGVGVLEAFVLVHPESVLVPERALRLFADVSEGQEVALMASRPEALVQRGANVARTALMRSKLPADQTVGGLMVYCAGCVGAIRDRMPQMLEEFRGVVGNIPYVSVFTFGEQGCVLPGHVDHGNLMACVLLLAAS